MHLHVRAQTRMLVVADDAQNAEEGPPMKKTRDTTLSPLDILQTLEIAVGGTADGSSSADLEPPHGPPPATPISKLRKVGKKVRRSSAYLGCDAARRRMACMAWMAALNGIISRWAACVVLNRVVSLSGSSRSFIEWLCSRPIACHCICACVRSAWPTSRLRRWRRRTEQQRC